MHKTSDNRKGNGVANKEFLQIKPLPEEPIRRTF
jgi:hypothetical protein